MILNWKMSCRSPIATDEAWHWPKTGYSTSGVDSCELRVELAVQYCVFCTDNQGQYWLHRAHSMAGLTLAAEQELFIASVYIPVPPKKMWGH